MEFFGLLMAMSLWGWLLIFLAIAIMTVLVESERGTVATFATIAMLSSLVYFTHYNLYSAVLYHPGNWIAWIAGWFIVGTLWGMFKWYLHVHKSLSRYQDVKAAFLQEKKAVALTPALAAEMSEHMNGLYGYGEYGRVSPTPPKAREHKGDIIRWMTYWPFSMIGLVLRDFVRRIWNHIYTWLVKTYDRIAAYVYRDVADDAAMMEQGRNMQKDPE